MGPYWGSYLLFALATIIFGAILGLLLVFILDCFNSTKVSTQQIDQQKLTTNDKEEDDGEIIDENNSDDGEDEIDGDEVEDSVEEKELAEVQSSNPDVRKRRIRKAD